MSALNTTKKPSLNLSRLSEVTKIAVKKVMDSPFVILDISTIYSVKQVRTKFDPVYLASLAESFKTTPGGISQPILVHEDGSGRHRIIFGECRFRAAPLAGISKIPSMVLKGLTESEIRRIQIAENNKRQNLTPFDEAMGVIEDVEKYGTDEAKIIWGANDSWISKRVGVKRYVPEVLALLEEEVTKDFELLLSLNRLHGLNKSKFDTFVSSLRSGEFTSGIRESARLAVSEEKNNANTTGQASNAPAATTGAIDGPQENGRGNSASVQPSSPHTEQSSNVAGTQAPVKTEPEKEKLTPSASAPVVKTVTTTVPNDADLQKEIDQVAQLGASCAASIRKIRENNQAMKRDNSAQIELSSIKAAILPVLSVLGDQAAEYLVALQEELKNTKH